MRLVQYPRAALQHRKAYQIAEGIYKTDNHDVVFFDDKGNAFQLMEFEPEQIEEAIPDVRPE